MKKLMVFGLMFILCVSLVNALVLEFNGHQTVNKEDYVFATYPGGDLDYPAMEPYLEVVHETVVIPGTRKIENLIVELKQPVPLNHLRLPIVDGTSKDNFRIEGEFQCDTEITAGAEIFSVYYENGLTHLTVIANPLNMDECGKYTFYKSMFIDYEYGEEIPSFFIDFDYPLKRGSNELTVHFSTKPEGKLRINGEYIGEVDQDYEILLEEPATALEEKYTLNLASDPEPYFVEYLENGEVMSRSTLTNIIPWGEFEFVIKKTDNPTVFNLVIEINNLLGREFPISFGATLLNMNKSYDSYDDLTADVSFEITAKPGINMYEQTITPGDASGIYLIGTAFDYSHKTGHNLFAVHEADEDTSEGLPDTLLEKAVKEVAEEKAKKNPTVKKSSGNADLIALIAVIVVVLMLGFLYYYYFVKK